MLQVLDDVFPVGPSVSLYHSSYVFATDIQHALDLLGGKKLVESAQLEVSFLMGKSLLESYQLQMRVHEAIEVEPQSVGCAGLEYPQHPRQLEGRRQFEVSEVSHEHGEIESLGQLVIMLESLIPHAHGLAIKIEDDQQLLKYPQLIASLFLLETLLFSFLRGRGVL